MIGQQPLSLVISWLLEWPIVQSPSLAITQHDPMASKNEVFVALENANVKLHRSNITLQVYPTLVWDALCVHHAKSKYSGLNLVSGSSLSPAIQND